MEFCRYKSIYAQLPKQRQNLLFILCVVPAILQRAEIRGRHKLWISKSNPSHSPSSPKHIQSASSQVDLLAIYMELYLSHNLLSSDSSLSFLLLSHSILGRKG